MNWQHFFAIIAIALLLWWMFRFIGQNKGYFSSQNLSQGFRTLGILALILIVVVGILVLISKGSL